MRRFLYLSELEVPESEAHVRYHPRSAESNSSGDNDRPKLVDHGTQEANDGFEYRRDGLKQISANGVREIHERGDHNDKQYLLPER